MNDTTKIGESNMENKMTDIIKMLETKEGQLLATQVLAIIAPIGGVVMKNPKLIALGMACFTACYVSKNFKPTIIINNH